MRDSESQQLDRIEDKLADIQQKEGLMSAELDNLVAKVTALTTVTASVQAAFAGLAQQIKDLAAAGGTPQQFTDLANQIDVDNQKLAAAVTANTPPAVVAKPKKP